MSGHVKIKNLSFGEVDEKGRISETLRGFLLGRFCCLP